jgi:uncharacterized membrane protein YeaQ/YmgE (transglycosylase-associated protein family)
MQYLNIIIIGALVCYLAYQLISDFQSGITENLTLRVVLLVFGLVILTYRIIQLRKQNNKY